MSHKYKIGFVCPTYSQFPYAERAISTFLEYTPGGLAIVVDDASPDWDDKDWQSFLYIEPVGVLRAVVNRFEQNGGLTRSWNAGLSIARVYDCEYAIAGNSDVIFGARWYEGLLDALNAGYHLVGPVSNAPGITAKGYAEVWRYDSTYATTDDQEYIDNLSCSLRERYPTSIVEAPVNGFFQMARVADWWSGAYDAKAGQVYKPSNEFTSEGRRNPTPLMTLNEDELQGRWAKLGRKTAVVPSSFIFHYRAVTRGPKYLRGRWFRPAPGSKP
jgi:hypothetical protein